MSFEWDEKKRRQNVRKHRIEFADAIGVFEDAAAMTLPDDESEDEERFVTMGADMLGRILVVVYAWRDDTIRVISARRATPLERKKYGEQ